MLVFVLGNHSLGVGTMRVGFTLRHILFLVSLPGDRGKLARWLAPRDPRRPRVSSGRLGAAHVIEVLWFE